LYSGCGTVFELTPLPGGEWQESILHAFTAESGGAFPDGAPVFDGADNLYGTIGGYGSYAIGGIFELSAVRGNSRHFDVLYSSGAGPGLLMDSLGDLYGEMGPGRERAGAIGELSPGSGGWNYIQLYSFCGEDSCPEGADPPTPPIWDDKGNLFGTTSFGGFYS
jgi:hypothetical protein